MDVRTTGSNRETRAARAALLVFCLLIAVSCGSKTRQLFFDIQPPSAAELAERAQQEEARRQATLAALEKQQATQESLFPGTPADNRPRPEIESATSWEAALEMLPKDYKNDADWAAALEQGLVHPRSGSDPTTPYVTAFKYDFIMADENPKNEAYFPHSAHTGWLGCKNCHMTIYPMKRNPASMKEMRSGASCGTCHGKNSVAFSLSNCKRCHLKR